MSERDRHQRVQELFESLLDCEPADRAAELQARCPEDAELRERVAVLLDADASSHRIEAARDHVLSAAATRAAPERIARYTLGPPLGEGSMGIVHRAEREAAPRTVALKLLRPGLLAEERIERFQHEGHVLGLLHHAGIARVYETGAYDGDREPLPFIAMELVDGPSLDVFVARGSLGQREIVELMARVADAVQYAHGQGVVHRDLKPSNILVDADGQPKVLDFGIARAVGDDVAHRTQVGEILGTLTTMSPEQVSGDPSLIDTRTDVYALGAILYRLLGGVWPIDPSGLPMAQALRKLAEDEPAPLGSLNRDVDRDLETVVAMALRKDKEERYASASAFASDLRNWLAGDAVEARPTSAVYLLRKFVRRNRSIVIGAVAAVIALIATIVTNNVLRGRADAAQADARTATEASLEAEEQEVLAEEKAQKELERAVQAEAGLAREAKVAEVRASEAELAAARTRRVANFLIDLFHARPDGLPTTAKDLLRRGAERIDDLADDAELYVQLLETVGNGMAGIGDPESALEYLERALAMRRDLGQEDGSAEGRILVGVSTAYSAMSDFPNGLEASRGAVEALRRAEEPDPEVLIDALNQKATMLQYLGQVDEAEALTDEALELAAGLSRSSLAQAKCLRMKAYHLTRKRRYSEAQPLLRESLRLARTLGGDLHPLATSGYNDLGWSCLYLDDLREASELFERGLELEMIVHGSDTSPAINARYGLATAYVGLGQMDDALALFDEALHLAIEAIGEEAALTAAVRSGYAEALALAGDYPAAKEMWEDTLAVDVQRFGPVSHEVQYGLGQLGGVHLVLGEYAEAEDCYKRSLYAQLKLEGPSAANVAISLDNLNGLIMRSADPAAAVEFGYELIEHWERGWPNGHLDKGRGYLACGIVLFESGAVEDSVSILETACLLLEAEGPVESLAHARNWLGQAMLALGESEAAEELLLMALDFLRKIPEDDLRSRSKAEAALSRLRDAAEGGAQ